MNLQRMIILANLQLSSGLSDADGLEFRKGFVNIQPVISQKSWVTSDYASKKDTCDLCLVTRDLCLSLPKKIPCHTA